jgi:GT2 family glycosyltransferase
MFRFKPEAAASQGAPVTVGRVPPALAEGTAIIISTRGRPDIVEALVEQLGRQTRPPDHIFVIGTSADDIARLDRSRRDLTASVGREGSSSQRNDGLTLSGGRFAHVVFFDDDFIPSRFWIERMAAIFAANANIVGMTGLVLADGTTTAGIGFEDAADLVAKEDAKRTGSGQIRESIGYGSNVGCNMAFRGSAIAGIAFDERLPLYGWLEDADFRSRIEKGGRFVRSEALWGVHLGHKKGRGRGVTLGYSQIANAAYLARKGTVPKSYLARLAARNMLANLAHSIRPEPFVDRRGRLRGNLLALADVMRGRVTPERILEL